MSTKRSPEEEFELELAKIDLKLKWIELKFACSKVKKWLLIKYLAVFGFAVFGVYSFAKYFYEWMSK